MLRLLMVVIVVLVLLVAPVYAHPGELDSRGGHHCWTNCAYWGYDYGEYHCHRSPCNFSDIMAHRSHGH